MKDWEVIQFYSKTCDGTFNCTRCLFNEWERKGNKLSNLTQESFDELKEIVEEEANKVDWSKVPVDTKILVRDKDDGKWRRRYFAKFENGVIYAWADGTTSFSNDGNCVTNWRQVKLYKEYEE